MSKKVTISIITATWNSAATLPNCLASVLRQNYPNTEHLIIDGGSTDGTLDIVNAYKHPNTYFKSEPDRGIYDALNKGIRLATGDIVGFLHSDDFYPTDNVLSIIAKAFEDPSVDAVYGDLDYVSQNDPSKVIRHWRSQSFDRSLLSWGWMPAHPTLYVRKEWYSRVGEFDISYHIASDYLSVLKLFSCPAFKSEYLPYTLVKMRLGGASNKSIASIILKTREDWRALRSCRFGALNALRAILWKNLGKIMQFI